MTKYECDRCLTLGTKPLQHVHVPEDSTDKYSRLESREQDKDLCPNCVKELREWIKPLNRPATSKSV